MTRRAETLKFINYINIEEGALSDINAIQNICFFFIVDLSQMYILTSHRIIKFNDVVDEKQFIRRIDEKKSRIFINNEINLFRAIKFEEQIERRLNKKKSSISH